jgi:hypothetical protein
MAVTVLPKSAETPVAVFTATGALRCAVVVSPSPPLPL